MSYKMFQQYELCIMLTDDKNVSYTNTSYLFNVNVVKNKAKSYFGQVELLYLHLWMSRSVV